MFRVFTNSEKQILIISNYDSLYYLLEKVESEFYLYSKPYLTTTEPKKTIELQAATEFEVLCFFNNDEKVKKALNLINQELDSDTVSVSTRIL